MDTLEMPDTKIYKLGIAALVEHLGCDSDNTKAMQNVRRKRLLCLNCFGTGILVQVELQNFLIFLGGISPT